MRMNAPPSSVRLFSKYAQSTMSRASSVTPQTPQCRRRPATVQGPNRRKRVKFALAAPLIPGAIERVGTPAEVETEGDRAEVELAPQSVHKIPPIAFRQL